MDIDERFKKLEKKTELYDAYMVDVGRLLISLSKNVQILSAMQEQEVVVFKKSYKDVIKALKKDADDAMSMNFGPIFLNEGPSP